MLVIAVALLGSGEVGVKTEGLRAALAVKGFPHKCVVDEFAVHLGRVEAAQEAPIAVDHGLAHRLDEPLREAGVRKRLITHPLWRPVRVEVPVLRGGVGQCEPYRWFGLWQVPATRQRSRGGAAVRVDAQLGSDHRVGERLHRLGSALDDLVAGDQHAAGVVTPHIAEEGVDAADLLEHCGGIERIGDHVAGDGPVGQGRHHVRRAHHDQLDGAIRA